MITYNVALNIIFGNLTVSQPMYIYVPFLVDEIIVLDSMYGNAPDVNDSDEYTLQSRLFNNTVVTLTMIDLDNQGIIWGRHDIFTVQFVNQTSINGLYTFTIKGIKGGDLENYYVLLQFVSKDG